LCSLFDTVVQMPTNAWGLVFIPALLYVVFPEASTSLLEGNKPCLLSPFVGYTPKCVYLLWSLFWNYLMNTCNLL